MKIITEETIRKDKKLLEEQFQQINTLEKKQDEQRKSNNSGKYKK